MVSFDVKLGRFEERNLLIWWKIKYDKKVYMKEIYASWDSIQDMLFIFLPFVSPTCAVEAFSNSNIIFIDAKAKYRDPYLF